MAVKLKSPLPIGVSRANDRLMCLSRDRGRVVPPAVREPHSSYNARIVLLVGRQTFIVDIQTKIVLGRLYVNLVAVLLVIEKKNSDYRDIKLARHDIQLQSERSFHQNGEFESHFV